MPDARLSAGKEQKTCQSPTCRAGLAGAGETWPAQRDAWASTALGGIRMHAPLGQKPLGQGISQAEKALLLRNAMQDGVPTFPRIPTHMPFQAVFVGGR